MEKPVLEEMAHLVKDLKDENMARAYAEKIKDIYLKCCAYTMLYPLSAKKSDIGIAYVCLNLIKDQGKLSRAKECIKVSEGFVKNKGVERKPLIKESVMRETISEFIPFLFLK